MKLKFIYKNWRGEVRERFIVPLTVWFGESPFHKGQQWFIEAWDFEDTLDPESCNMLTTKNFAVKDILSDVDEIESDEKNPIKDAELMGAVSHIVMYHGLKYWD